MKNQDDNSFERWLNNALRSTGYLFPEKDEQMEAYERNVELKELPERLKTPEFVYQNDKQNKSKNAEYYNLDWGDEGCGAASNIEPEGLDDCIKVCDKGYYYLWVE